MARTNKNHPEKRREIVYGALDLFLENTYELTTTTDIMNKMKISRGALYHYFGSKEEILEAVVQLIIEEILKDISHWLDNPEMDALSKLEYFFLPPAQNSIDLIVAINTHMEKYEQSIFAYRMAQVNEYIAQTVLSTIIQQGVDEHIFVTTSPDLSAVLLYTAVKYLLIKNNETIPFTKDSLPQYTNQLARLLSYDETTKNTIENMLLHIFQQTSEGTS